MMKARKSILLTTAAVLTLLLAAGTAPAFAQGTMFVVNDQVGIGVDTPEAGAKLHVRAASVGPVDAIYLENTTGPSRLKLVNQAAAISATTDKEWTINSNGDLRFGAPGSGPEMRLYADGTLAVRTAISVGGVGLNVPDFVFAPDYNLRPLSEVRSFIQQNQHLPDVPSAEEVKQNGLNMTEMQILLLQKVEELTLYTIQQQETIEALQGQLAQVSK